jgi:hypothetical protein
MLRIMTTEKRQKFVRHVSSFPFSLLRVVMFYRYVFSLFTILKGLSHQFEIG